jgi:hypothetical protein
MASYSSKRRQNLSHCTLAKGGRQRRVVGSAGECHDKASSQTKGSRGWFDMVPGFLGLHVWHPLLPFTGTHSTLPFFQMHRYTLLSLWYAGTTAAAYNTTSSPPLQTGTSLEIIKLERDTNLHAGTTKAGSVSIVRPWFISTVVRFRRPSFHKNSGHTPTTPTINTATVWTRLEWEKTDTFHTHVSSVHRAVRMDEATCTPRPVLCCAPQLRGSTSSVQTDAYAWPALSAAVRACMRSAE